MKNKPRDLKDVRAAARVLRARRRAHDPLLLLNMSHFNFVGGWRRTFAKSEYERAYA
jgi:hypothetical protein